MNLRALLTPVLIAVVASIGAFAMLVVFAAGEQDSLSVSSQRTVLRQYLANFSKNLEVLAVDNSWWDTAVEKIIVETDQDWISRTIGETVKDIEYLDGALIVRQDKSIIYASLPQKHQGLKVIPQGLLASSLGEILRRLAITPDGRKSSTRGMVKIGDALVTYGVGLVRSDRKKEYAATDGNTHPALVFFSILSAEEIEKLGNDLSVRDLRFTGLEPARPGSLLLTDGRGAPVGMMVWTPKTPGTEMIKKVLLPAVLLLILVAATMTRFANRVTTLLQGLEQASKSKTAFLASMSHEVRTPLNSILGFSEMMALELFGKIEGAKNKEYLQLIQNSGKHLLTIINDILDISKLEAGKFSVYAEEIRPQSVIEETVNMVDPSAHDRDVTVTQRCDGTKIFSDERIMRQVLINILSNAIKYTEQGGAVHISGEIKADHYQIRVADNGVGMTETEIETALATFGQVHNDLAIHHSGTGLGLPLVTRFMQLLGGKMSISSNPGKGTSVTLNFPTSSKTNKQ